MQEVSANAQARGEHTRTVLVEEMAQRLLDGEELQDWVPCFYDGRGSRNRSIAIDGFSTDEMELDGTLHVLVADVRAGEVVQNLSNAEVAAVYSKAASFVLDARAGRLHDALEPSTPAADLARLVHHQSKIGALKTLRVHVLSNAGLSPRYKEIESSSVDAMKVELQLWDLSRLHRMAAAGGREALDIDLTAFVPEGIAGLPAGIGDTGYTAYLCVVPGRLLADIYEQYGSRLLEGNVRAFLSARAKVNVGIRKTIMSCPDRFFAFNNGITATAASVEIDDDGGAHRIVRVRDLQIVNGGQTTASLYNARLRDRANLDGIFVQMKLSVLEPEVAQSMIPEIARFANTQTKVSDADLFANHPFHRRVEELSRQIWARRPNSTQDTHWFFERARAQYQTEQFKLKPSEKKAFLIKNPKEQLITKTDLAKFENSWRKLPHLVSFGAQKNFMEYAKTVREEFENKPEDFNERWFQHLVAKAILFKTTERLVSNAAWYSGGYRANIVTYAIARLVRLIEEEFPGHILDLDRIWKAQQLSDAVTGQLLGAAEAAFRVLIAPPSHWKNVTEWAKKEPCWEALMRETVAVEPELENDLKGLDEERYDRRDARGQEREVQVINAVMEVVRLGAEGYWRRAAAWPQAREILSPVEFDIVITASRKQGWIPSDAQARRLMSAHRKLEEDGLT